MTGTFPEMVTVPPRGIDEGETDIVAAPDAAAAPKKKAVSATVEAARRRAGATGRSEDIPSRWLTSAASARHGWSTAGGTPSPLWPLAPRRPGEGRLEQR